MLLEQFIDVVCGLFGHALQMPSRISNRAFPETACSSQPAARVTSTSCRQRSVLKPYWLSTPSTLACSRAKRSSRHTSLTSEIRPQESVSPRHGSSDRSRGIAAASEAGRPDHRGHARRCAGRYPHEMTSRHCEGRCLSNRPCQHLVRPLPRGEPSDLRPRRLKVVPRKPKSRCDSTGRRPGCEPEEPEWPAVTDATAPPVVTDLDVLARFRGPPRVRGCGIGLSPM